MANVFNFTDWLSMEALRILQNKLYFGRFFDTSYNKEFTRDFAVGEQVRVPLPQRWLIRDGLQFSEQPINRIYTTIACDQVFGIDSGFDTMEQALKMERSREQIKAQYLEPAMAQLAQELDSRCANWAMLNTNNIVGVLGTQPATFIPYANARQRMVENAGYSHEGENAMIVSPSMMTSLVTSTTSPAPLSLFNPGDELSKAFKKGYYGEAQGFEWMESMSLYSQTAGTWAGAVTVAAGSLGNQLNVACTTGDTFNAGDVFNIALVNNVNPATRRIAGAASSTSTVSGKLFTVLTASVGVASAATLTISPAIYGPGSQYQNVDALPVVGQALTLFPGTASPNGKSGINGLALNKGAFALVGVKMANPTAVEVASYFRDPETGLSIAFVKAFDPIGRRFIMRWDVGPFGFGNLYNDQCAVRILSLT